MLIPSMLGAQTQHPVAPLLMLVAVTILVYLACRAPH